MKLPFSIGCVQMPFSLSRIFSNGDGIFARMSSSQAGPIVSRRGYSTAAGWADYDGDGDLDALVCNSQQAKNLFYRNNGNGTFTQLFRPDIGDLVP